jgi:hypothetical protein
MGMSGKSIRPVDEWARIRLEGFRDALIGEAVGLERRARPEQQDRIGAAKSLLDVRLTEILEHASAIDGPFARAQFLRCIFDALAGTFQIGSKGARDREMARFLAQTDPAREARAAKKDARRKRMAPFVTKVRGDFPNEDATQIRKRLDADPEFKKSFRGSRNTIIADIAHLIEKS